MKRLSFVILSILLSMSLCLPVMALDLDLKEDEKKEDIKDDYKEEEKKKENNSKYLMTLNSADYIYFNDNGIAREWNTSSIEIGQEYYVEFYGRRVLKSNDKGDNFIRGQEGDVLSRTAYSFWADGTVRAVDIIGESSSNYDTVNKIVIVEPEPEPTLEPTPEPTPTPDETPVSDNTVSWNSVSENLISIENEIRG